MDIPQVPFPAAADHNHQINVANFTPVTSPLEQPPNALVELASHAYALGDFEAAFACYERLLLLEPENSVLHANRSAILQRMAKNELALEAAELAIKFDPEWPKGHFRRGEALLALGSLEEAVMAHAEAVRLSHGEDGQFRLALLDAMEFCPLFGAQFQPLLSQLELANLGEDCFALFAAMAEAFLAANQPQIALEMAEKSAHFPAPNRKFEMARLGHLALSHCKLGNWVDAIEAMEGRLEIAVEIGDEFFQLDTHEAMSNLYATKMGNLEKAIWHKKKQFNIIEKLQSTNGTLATQKRHSEIQLELASLHMANGGMAESQALYKSILQQKPSNCHALLGLGRTLLAQDDISGASALFTRVERLEAELGSQLWREALLLRAKCQLAKNDVTKSVELLKKLLADHVETSEDAPVEFKAELYNAAAQIHLANGDAVSVKYWAKKLLKMGYLLVNSRMQAEALQLLMMIYMQGKQCLNASKVAAKLWKLLEAEMNPQSNNEWMLEIMGTIGTFWRAMENLEEAKKVFAKQLKIQEEQQGGWIFTAMELAEIELELENLDASADLLDRIEKALKTQEASEPNEKQINELQVALLQSRAKIGWKQRQQEDAVHQIEQALMLAQEHELTQREASCCVCLGEWASTEDGQEHEASVYLHQAIVLGRKMAAETAGNFMSWRNNAKLLLRAFSALSIVQCRQSHWEDALPTVRAKLRLQRELDVSALERLQTMLQLAKILLQSGVVEAAEKLLLRVKMRAMLLEADEEIGLAETLLNECHLTLATSRGIGDEEDYVNLKQEFRREEMDVKMKPKERKSSKNYRKRRSFIGYESENSEADGGTQNYSIGCESDVESTISGAFVLGVDMPSEEEEDENLT